MFAVKRRRTKRPWGPLLYLGIGIRCGLCSIGGGREAGCRQWRAGAYVREDNRSVRGIDVKITFEQSSCSGTVPGGEFNWGGCLPKSNGGAQRSAQPGWQCLASATYAQAGLTARTTVQESRDESRGLVIRCRCTDAGIAQRIKRYPKGGTDKTGVLMAESKSPYWHLDVGSSPDWGLEQVRFGFGCSPIKAARRAGFRTSSRQFGL